MLYKAQVIYAIKMLMDIYETEEVDFLNKLNKPSYTEDNVKYEITSVTYDNMQLSIDRLPVNPFSFRIDHVDYNENSKVRLKTLENIFYACYKEFTDYYGTIDLGDNAGLSKEKLLEKFAEDAFEPLAALRES